MNKTLIPLLLLLGVSIGTAQAKGHLAARCEALPNQILGVDDAGFAVEVDDYKIETGKCYKLLIQSSGMHEYILQAPEFFHYIWIRKLEIGKIELKVSGIHSIDFDADVDAELHFVAIRPGRYEVVDKVLGELGTRFSFTVE